jgi:hypothetical protein
LKLPERKNLGVRRIRKYTFLLSGKSVIDIIFCEIKHLVFTHRNIKFQNSA